MLEEENNENLKSGINEITIYNIIMYVYLII